MIWPHENVLNVCRNASLLKNPFVIIKYSILCGLIYLIRWSNLEILRGSRRYSEGIPKLILTGREKFSERTSKVVGQMALIVSKGMRVTGPKLRVLSIVSGLNRSVRQTEVTLMGLHIREWTCIINVTMSVSIRGMKLRNCCRKTKKEGWSRASTRFRRGSESKVLKVIP